MGFFLVPGYTSGNDFSDFLPVDFYTIFFPLNVLMSAIPNEWVSNDEYCQNGHYLVPLTNNVSPVCFSFLFAWFYS